MSQLAWFSCFCFSAAGVYGISSPSTTPTPAGMLNAAPSATTGPIRAACVWMSQFAVFITCQMPVKFGLPSLVRGTSARLGHRRRGGRGNDDHGRQPEFHDSVSHLISPFSRMWWQCGSLPPPSGWAAVCWRQVQPVR